MRDRTHRRASSLLLAFSCAFATHTANAEPATFLVGGDACDFDNLPAAISAAAAHPGPDTIHVAMNATYTAQALKIGAQDLALIGGFATCASPAPTPGASTVLSGLGGAADSVIEFTGAGQRALTNLVIRDGDESNDGDGGGIDFAGEGVLVLSRVVVANNRAGFGGGIYFESTGSVSAELTLGSDVVIQNNVAAQSGGGVRISGNAVLLMLSERSTIVGNEAQGLSGDSGYGGGLQVAGRAYAEIASPGFVNFGAISGNRAKYGGGLALTALQDGGGDGKARLYTVDPQRPVRIDHNIASSAGGGVYLGANFDFASANVGAGVLNAYEFRIDHNRAPDGAAIYIGSDSAIDGVFGAFVDLNVPGQPLPASAVFCATGTPCNLIDGNVVAQANGQPASGPIIQIAELGLFRANRVAIAGNTGTDVIHGLTTRTFTLDNCLIAGNTLGSGRVVAVDGATDGPASIRNCTIAGNTFGLSDTLALTGGPALIRDSIIWQPGKLSLGDTHGPLDGANVITNDPASLAPIQAVNLDPRFIDPGRADYRLRAASPAVDVGLPLPGDDRDLDNAPHDQDLPVANAFGPRDLGAYERQGFLPLVLNASFSADTAHWFDVTAGVSGFDATENAPGSPPGGAMSFHWENTPVAQGRVVSRAQCIHLPLPGTYRLDGFARTTGGTAVSGQAARLQWALRRDGTEACTTGAADAQGEITLASGTAWTRAPTPARITITPDQFTRNSSITVSLVMVATGVTFPPGMHGWFDEISLTLELDALFSDGFE